MNGICIFIREEISFIEVWAVIKNLFIQVHIVLKSCVLNNVSEWTPLE
jgi:hypothetical protein